MPTVTEIDVSQLIISVDNNGFRTELVTFAGAGTVSKGTILARDSVSGNMVPFVIGGSTNENGIPKAVAAEDVVATGAGNVRGRVLQAGVVDFGLLIVNADGDNSNITNAHIDQLRDYGIRTESLLELNKLATD